MWVMRCSPFVLVRVAQQARPFVEHQVFILIDDVQVGLEDARKAFSSLGCSKNSSLMYN